MAESRKKKNVARAAVVVNTADGRRLKPECPICKRVYWGKLVPPGTSPSQVIIPMIPARVADKMTAMEIQQWVCLNCGHLWHRTGGIEERLSKEKDDDGASSN